MHFVDSAAKVLLFLWMNWPSGARPHPGWLLRCTLPDNTRGKFITWMPVLIGFRRRRVICQMNSFGGTYKSPIAKSSSLNNQVTWKTIKKIGPLGHMIGFAVNLKTEIGLHNLIHSNPARTPNHESSLLVSWRISAYDCSHCENLAKDNMISAIRQRKRPDYELDNAVPSDLISYNIRFQNEEQGELLHTSIMFTMYV